MRPGEGTLLLGWVLGSPFAVATLVAVCAPLRRLVSRLYLLTMPLGWGGALVLCAGAFSVVPAGAMLVGAPLAGLAVWSRGEGGGDDDGDDPGPPPDDHDDPGVDWDEFERALRDYAGPPRAPVAA